MPSIGFFFFESGALGQYKQEEAKKAEQKHLMVKRSLNQALQKAKGLVKTEA